MDLDGRFALHSLHPVPMCHQRGPVPGRDEALEVLQEEEVQEAGPLHDIGRVDIRRGHHVASHVRMVSSFFRSLCMIFNFFRRIHI